MKAEERHRLKTNELDMKLSELLKYVSGPGKKYLVGGIIVLLALIAGSLMFSNFKSARQDQSWLLQSYLQVRQLNWDKAVQQSRLGAAGNASQIAPASYTSEELAELLEELSDQAQGTAVGMTALLQSAETLRSRLYMEPQYISETQKQEICDSAEKKYNEVLSKYSSNPMAAGAAQLGLAILAEDRGDWKKARELYQKITADADGKLVHTVYSAQAARRLKLLDDIAVEINFAAVPVEIPTDKTADLPLDAKPASDTPAVNIESSPSGAVEPQPDVQENSIQIPEKTDAAEEPEESASPVE